MNLIFKPLTPDIDRKNFDCGNLILNSWFAKMAPQDMRRHFATVIVACDSENPARIAGYYTLSAASVLLEKLPEELTHKFPRYPHVPAIRLGRLAVEKDLQRKHIGSLLLINAFQRACNTEIAWALFMVDAKNESVNFYKKFMFNSFADNEFCLWLHRKQVQKFVSDLSIP